MLDTHISVSRAVNAPPALRKCDFFKHFLVIPEKCVCVCVKVPDVHSHFGLITPGTLRESENMSDRQESHNFTMLKSNKLQELCMFWHHTFLVISRLTWADSENIVIHFLYASFSGANIEITGRFLFDKNENVYSSS